MSVDDVLLHSPHDVVIAAFADLRGADRDEAFMVLEREVRRLNALQAALVGTVQESQSFTDDGHRSAVAWAQAVSNCTRGTAIQRVQTAAMLRFLPGVAAAAAAGDLGADQLRLFTRLYTNPRCRDQLPASEALLVGHASRLTCREFTQVCIRWVAHADPDGALANHEAARQNRSASYSQIDEGYELRARGDALSGDMFNDILEAHAQAELHADLAQRIEMYGEHANRYPLARTAAQRRHDALMAMARKAAGTRADTDREPLVVIHCTAPTLHQAIREYFGDTSSQPATSERMRLCETQSGAPVSLHDLAVAALHGQVQRIVTDPTGTTIDLGRRSRLFVGAARDAVLLAGDRCTRAGCEIRSGPIEIDHITRWTRPGGETRPANGAPMCPPHHHHRHNHGFTVAHDETGWHHYRADGTEIAPRGRP